MLLEKNAKLVFIGDSVTDCGRARPVGEGLFGAIGTGYAGYVNALLDATVPQMKIRVVNMGSSGNNVRDLEARWQTDVMDLKPDWLSIMIGINDVWRQFDCPLQTESHVYPDEYAETLDRLVAGTKAHVKGLVLMTPYYMEPNRDDPMRRTMDRYGAIAGDVAKRHGTLFVDTQSAFDAYFKEYHPNNVAWDRIHPNHIGHMIIARQFLNAVGYVWNPG
jgi:lysophospholipase L1-like esterase